MIPIDTPPGTEIICVNDEEDAFVHLTPNAVLVDGMQGLERGALYHVRDFVFNPIAKAMTVRLWEIYRPLVAGPEMIESGYAPERFRLLEKPHELYSLLDVVSRETETVG